MDLENLKFKVDSKEVLSAVEDLGKLRTKIEELSKPLDNLAKATTKADKAVSDTAKSSQDATAKTEKLAKATKEATTATEGLGEASNKSEKKRKKSVDILDRETDKLKLINKELIKTADGYFAMAEGLTASQASSLATLSNKGATTEYLKLLSTVYANQNKVLGANPFDQSTDGVAKLKRELSDLNKVEEYSRQGYNLTTKQLSYLNTSLEKISQSYKEMGKSENEILQAQKAMEAEFMTTQKQLQDKQKLSYQMNQQAKESARTLDKETKANESYNKQQAIYNDLVAQGYKASVALKASRLEMRGISKESVNEYLNQAKAQEKIDAEKEYQRQIKISEGFVKKAYAEQAREQDKKNAKQKQFLELQAIENKALEFQAQGYQRGESVRGARSIIKSGVDEGTVKDTLNQSKAVRDAIQNEKDLAKSRAYLAEETARVENAVNRMTDAGQVNNRVSEEMSRNLDKYSKHLTRVGITGEEATTRLNKYHKALQTINEREVQNKVNYLSRSLAPQISDVAVSLYGGMSPMTVLMQQGLQVRDMIGQVGLETKKTNEAMKKAGAEFIGSLGATLRAMGGLFVGVFQKAGNNFVDFTNKFNPVAKGLDAWSYSLINAGKEQSLLYKSIEAIGVGVRGFVAGAFAIATGAILGYIAVIYSASKAHDTLVKGIAETGGAFGLTAGKIQDMSQALVGTPQEATNLWEALGNTLYGTNVTSTELAEAFLEISKNSKLAGQDIESIALASASYADASGKAIADVVKQYGELAKDPVKGLIELGSTTGDVTQKTIEYTRYLVEHGRQAEAVAHATETLSASHARSTVSINDNLSTTGEVLKTVGQLWDNFWASVKGVQYQESYANQIKALEKTKELASSGKGGGFSSILDKSKYGYAGGDTGIDKQIANLKKLQQAEADRLAVQAENARLAKQQDEITNLKKESMSKVDKIQAKITEAEGKRREESKRGSKASITYIETMTSAITRYKAELVETQKAEAKRKEREAKAGSAPKSEAQKYREKVDTESTRVIDNLRKSYEDLYAKEYELLPIEEQLNKIRTDPQYADYNVEAKKEINNLGRKALVKAILLDIEKQEQVVKKQIEEQEANRTAKSVKALEATEDKMQSYLQSLKEEGEALDFERTLLGKSAEEQTRLTNIRKEYTKSTALLLELEKQRANIQPQDKAKYEALIAQAKADINSSEARGNERTDLDKQKKAFDELKAKRDQFTEGFADAMTTAILEGGSAGATKLKDLMKQMFIREPIKVLMQGIMNSMTGGSGGSSSGNPLGDLFSSFMKGSSSGSSSGGFLDSIMSFFGGKSGGQAIGGDKGGSAFGNTASTAGSMGSYMQMAGGAMQGYAMGSALNKAGSGGYQVSKGYSQFQDIGSAVMGAIGGPLMGALVGAGSAIFNRAFGRKQVGEGYMGSFSNGNVSSSKYKEEKGGWFRSDKLTKSSLSSREADLWNSNFKSMQQGAINMAKAFGIGGESLKQFTGDVKINLQGLSAEEATKKIQEQFNNIQRTMLETIPAFENFSYAGETAGKAFDKLLEDVRNSLDAVGVTTESIGQIILQNMTGEISAEEAGKALSENVIGGIYDSIASTYAQGISQAFMTQIIQPVMGAILAGVPISQAISQEAIQTVVAQAQASSQALSAILSNPDFVNAMNGIQQAIGGIVGVSSGVASNVVANNRAYEKMMQERSSLELKLLELQGNTAEIRRRELEALDKSNRGLQKQIWLLEDQKKKADELKSAWQGVTDSLSEEIKRIKEEILGMSANPANNIQRQFDEMTARARRGDVEAGKLLPELSKLLLEQRKNDATTLEEFMLVQAQVLASLEATRRKLKQQYGVDIPAYAKGGNHAGGLAIVGEQGAELVNLPPSTVHTNSNSRSLLTEANRELVQEVINLRNEVTYLRAEVRADVVTNSKTTKILERVTRNDDVVYTTAVV